MAAQCLVCNFADFVSVRSYTHSCWIVVAILIHRIVVNTSSRRPRGTKIKNESVMFTIQHFIIVQF